jgi:hypothetical protein
MSRPARSLPAELARHCARALVSVAVWTVWLVLALLLAFQVYMATHHELGVPRFILRALEERLAASGLQAGFGRTLFDPSGRILIRDLRLKLPGFAEPVVTAKSVYGRLDWGALLAGRFEPVEVRVTGLAARVPALLSPSGRADEIVHDLDAVFFPRGSEIRIADLTGYVGALQVAGQGTVQVPSGSGRTPSNGPLPLADLITRHYAQWSRSAAASGTWIADLDRPVLRVQLTPAAPGVSRIDFALSAEAAHAPAPWSGEAAGMRVTGSWLAGAEDPLPGGLLVAAQRLGLPGGAVVEGLSARVRFAAGPGAPGGRAPPWPKAVDFAALRATAAGVATEAPVGQAELGQFPQVAVITGFRLWGEPVLLQAAGDARTRAGTVDFQAALGPRALEGAATLLKVDLRPFLSWSRPIAWQGSAQFGPEGKFRSAAGQIQAEGVSARGVRIDELRAEWQFAGARLSAPHAYARLGDDYARGSFEEDLASANYRFLLDGRLRPLHITPWIAGSWWGEFFGNLGFPAQGPEANIDLSGCWTDGRRARIFLRVDAPDMAIQSYAVDRLRGRMFLRPQFSDVLAFTVDRQGGQAEGQFTRRFDLAADDWRSIDATMVSTLEPMAVLQLAGPDEAAAVSDFTFARPPQLKLAAHFDGPASGRGRHRQIGIGFNAEGLTTFHTIPIDRLTFEGKLADDDLTLTGIDASIAGGAVTGHMALTGAEAGRTLDFLGMARDVSLTRAAALVQKLSSKPPGAKTEKFLQDKSSVKIDASIAARGQVASLQSFHGSGSAQLHGGEIGEMRILGALSQLLRFTALRFTGAEVAFQLNGSQLDFPSVVISGTRAAITAHGEYSLALHQLDFRARLDPFKESRGTTRGFMDLALTSIASALEVRLTGSVDRPKWAFVNGPTNLLWSLRSPNSVAPAKPGLPIPLKPAS